MSSPRVLVGLAAERALPSALRLRCNYGSARAGAVMCRQQTGARPCQISTGIHHPQKPLHRRPFHITTRRPFHTTTRRPKTFHLAPPAPPSIHPHTSTATPAPLPEQFRTLMRLVTHSVVVCTSTHPTTTTPAGPSPSPPTPRAMTMSSFTSLALHPTPVISFNIATPSRTFDAVSASRRFNIHILADDVSGARIADYLAGGNAGDREVFERLPAEAGCEVEMGNKDKGEAPVLSGEGVLYVLRCKLLDQPEGGLVRVRDHVIVLGEVEEIVEGAGAEREVEERFGLLYADRRYRQLGGCIAPDNTEKR